MENIFSSREMIIKKWNEIVSFAESEKISWGIDHIIPECFYKETDMIIPSELGICVPECAGLINSNLELLFCNQYPIALHHFIGCTETKEQVQQILREKFFEKQELALGNKCRGCDSYGERCNGGCFVHKQIYSV